MTAEKKAAKVATVDVTLLVTTSGMKAFDVVAVSPEKAAELVANRQGYVAEQSAED